jgi:hypothetical protein
MQRIPSATLILFLSLLLLASTGHAAGDFVFGDDQVHSIDIQFDQPAFFDSLTLYYLIGDQQYMAATVVADGVVIDSVGVRLKGNASFSHPNDKKSFRIAFDEYRDPQRWDGLKGVHLNNCWEDPSFLREKLHLDMCEDAGIPGPRANFVEVKLNGELWGLYSLVETVDKTFLSSRFGDNDGNLYKAVDGFLNPNISDFVWYGSDPSIYYGRYELKTPEGIFPWQDLVGVIDSLENGGDAEAALPPVVNLLGVYRAFAMDILFANLDSYLGSGRNFYVYFNPAGGRMEWSLWDVGMSFGSYWGEGSDYETVDLFYSSDPAQRPLAATIFTTPVLREAYLYTLCCLFNNYLSYAELDPRIEELADLVRPFVQADPRKMYTDAQFEENLNSDIEVGGHRKPGLRAFVLAREANVQAQLDALDYDCDCQVESGEIVINEFVADNNLIADPAGEFDDWIELYNNSTETIHLDGMFLSDDSLAPLQWQFPAGTTVAPDEYLIIWADNDLSQDGLHASFKLSASGEQVLLSDAQAGLLDEITFAVQLPDLSMARHPNGTGIFTRGLPTFADNNDEGISVDPWTPTQFTLYSNSPNPFQSSTMIRFNLPHRGAVDLRVFDIRGREVAVLLDEELNSGLHQVEFESRDLAAGLYFYRLRGPDGTSAKRMLILK